MTEDLVDRIYEAAFVPELWPDVLERLGSISSAKSGSVLIMDGESAPRWKSTEIVREALDGFIESDAWRHCAMAQNVQSLILQGFVLDSDMLEAEQMAEDEARKLQRALGLGWQLACVTEMPTAEWVVFTFEHLLTAGPPENRAIEVLNATIPHLSRAGLMAARLGMQQAQATVSALQAIGLPAAVMGASGRVRAVNALLGELPQLFLPAAFGKLTIADPDADRLLQQAFEAAQSNAEPPVRSIAVRATEDRPALVVHVLPLRRAAHDIFSGADLLVAATMVGAGNLSPSPTILTGLFDLTPAEARLASALASGRSLKDAASESNITFKTGRTYLERIFVKTGTHRQTELVALLKSAEPLA